MTNSNEPKIPSSCNVYYVDSELLPYTKNNVLQTAFSDEARQIWTHLFVNDILIIKKIFEVGMHVEYTVYHIEYTVYKVCKKELDLSSKSPLILELEELCYTISVNDYFLEISHFQKIKHSKLRSILRKSENYAENYELFTFEKTKPQILFEKDNFKVKLASSNRDFNFIKKLSANHAFRYTNYYMALILIDKGKDVAALVFDKANCIDKKHQAEELVFSNDIDYVRRNSIAIKRIFAPKRLTFKYHEMLLECLFKISPSLITNRAYSTIQAFSFDYHPLAPMFKMSPRMPRTKSSSFFYYKYLYNDDGYTPLNRKALKKFLKARRKESYYVLIEDRDVVQKILRTQQCSIKTGSDVGRGNLYLLKKDDIVFVFSREDNVVRSIYSVVNIDQQNTAKNKYEKTFVISFEKKYDKTNFSIPQKYIFKNLKLVELLEKDALKYINRKSSKINLSDMANEYFIVSTAGNIKRGIDMKTWGLKESKDNQAIYSVLEENDVVYLIANKQQILAKAVVKNKQIIRTGPYQQFPLAFQLGDLQRRDELLPDQTIKFLRSKSGGIIKKNNFLANEIEETSKKIIKEVPKPAPFVPKPVKEKKLELKPGELIVKPNRNFLPDITDVKIEKNSIFVIQAWKYKDTVYPWIERYLKREGFTCFHASKKDTETVMGPIWEMLNKCEAVIVDFSDRRPNVYLEFGMALVLGKPIIPICLDSKDAPSDVPQSKYLEYFIDVRDDGKISIDPYFEENLVKKVKDTLGR